MSIPTDDTPLEEPKNPDTCNVFHLIRLFASPEKVEEVRKKYQAGGYGYGHAKLELLEILKHYLAPFQEKRKYYEENFSLIEAYVKKGNEKANKIVDAKYHALKKIVGLEQ